MAESRRFGLREGTVVTTKTFTVDDIHCESCEAAIRKGLARVDGIRQVEPAAAENEVTVAFDESALNEDAVAERLRDIGYPVVG